MSHTGFTAERSLEHTSIKDRREAPRFDASAIMGFKSINPVGEPKVKLINISRFGVLIEGRNFLSPGSTISLQLITAEAVYLIKGRISRCRTSSLDNKGFKYQSAVFLDEEFMLLPANTGTY